MFDIAYVCDMFTYHLKRLISSDIFDPVVAIFQFKLKIGILF
jgi:hypothetical protein